MIVKETQTRVAPAADSLGETVTIDALGDAPPFASNIPKTTASTTVDRTKALVTETTSFTPYPTGDLIRVSKAGLIVKERNPALTTVSRTYDNLRRLERTIERGSVKTNFEYQNGSRDRITKVGQDYGGASPLIIVENTYSGTTGRLTHTIRKNYVGGSSQDEDIYYTYTKMGQVDYQYGDGTFPVDYVYNSYNQLTDIYQYRNDAGTTNTHVKQIFDAYTGLLEEKRHYSTTSSYKATKYQYTALDQVKKRTWARSGDEDILTTTYGYSIGSTASYGLLLSTTYDGSSTLTPSVTRTYDLMGRLKTVDDWAGTREFKPDSTYGNLVTLEEDLDTSDNDKYGSYTMRYTRESGSGSTVRGRPNGIELGTGTGGTFSRLQYQRYDFDATSGRIASVVTHTSQYNWTRSFAYTYHTDSDLVEDVAYGTYYKKTTGLESWRNNRSVVQTDWSSATRADFSVQSFTWQSQIEDWRLSGTSGASNELIDIYGWTTNTADVAHDYDERGQVTSRDYQFSGPSDESYSFDTAGNPTSFQGQGYTVNGLNQIEPTGGTTTDFEYDDDGNLEEDDDWYYTYDAENRLTKMVSKTESKRLEFNYDYLNRRVEKRVYNATSGGTLTLQRRFIYDGFNCVAEIDGSRNMKRSYHWGLDRASSLTATGGVEALLLITDWDGEYAYWPVYDLSSNVVGLIGRTGNFDAAYSYDAFGQATKEGDSSQGQNDINPYRFATKYTDDESGLVYFGHRYYNPKTGRFINRDPIGELGGLNLYRYTNNDTVNRSDYLGLCAEGEVLVGGECFPEDMVTTVSADRVLSVSTTFYGGWLGTLNYYTEQMYQQQMDEMEMGSSLRSDISKSAAVDQKDNSEDVDKELLKKLCASQAGRDLVDRINNENINIFSSETAFPSTRHLGFFDSTTYRNTGGVNIYVNRAVDTVREFRDVGYRGPGREGQALIIRHEIGEYDALRNMPGEPSWVRDAHARWDADQFARSAGLQPWFPGSDLQDLLDANAPSPSDPDGYSSRNVGRSDYERMIADRIRITGFDCSRLEE